MTDAVTDIPAEPPAPEAIFNCPQCSHYLPEGTLACPECGRLVYSDHLRALATVAMTEEADKQWPAAIARWQQALLWVPEADEQAVAIRNRIEGLSQKVQGQSDWKVKWQKRLGPLAPVVFFLAKAKTYLLFAMKAKFLLSFVGFFAIYWALFGWKFGLGFTLAILIHEMGHFVAAKRKGLKVDLPVFLPGLGAYVRWYAQGMTLDMLSTIALAGPLFGLIAAVACGIAGIVTQNPLWSALAHVGAWINLVNLIPIFGLDGAQATYSLDRTQRWLVLATALIFFGYLHEGPFAFVAMGMAWRLWKGGYPDKPSSKTLMQFVLLLFALGIVIFVFPDTRRTGF